MRLAIAVCSVAIAMAQVGCGIGVGSMSATKRPMLGTKKIDDAALRESCASSVTRNYSTGRETRTDACLDLDADGRADSYEVTGAGRFARWVAMGGGFKRGTSYPTFNGTERASETIYEIDATVLGHVPLRRIGLSLGVTYLIALEGEAFFTGYGFRGSLAPIPQVSLDAAFTWIGGNYDTNGNASFVDLSGTRASIGGTVMLYGLQATRLALAVAYTTTNAGMYQSHGYTYQLVYTLW